VTATVPVAITLYASVGDSEVMNRIGRLEVDVQMRAVEARDTNAVAEAEAVITLDLPAALREMADRIERGES
jgi:hypothetical protein